MDKRKFNLYNWIVAAFVTLVSAVTYLSTMESSASFWDCGEFIASSYKFEVGHPPGNPVFQLFARIFTMPFSGENAAVAVNALSAICSAFTIFFLYLTIVFFAKRLLKPFGPGEDKASVWRSVAVFASAAVGSLAYAFSDTFWFSAVEGEVYAMSSLFTAMVFWAMTRWYDQAETPFANRWIVLISFLMGLSIGVHLLNLLTIPALVFMVFYRRRENAPYTFWQSVGIFLIGVVILGLVNFVIIPYLPKVAAYFDLFFVNTLGLPFNSGAAFFMLGLFALCFWGLFSTRKKGKVMANTVLLCFTSIIIGFSLFSICIIRSNAKTPTNEYQPDNPFTLVRYLSREQYGSTPLLYGQYFDAPAHATPTRYWAPVGDKYLSVEGQPQIVYDNAGKMFFPRMWSTSADHIEFYKSYIDHGKKVKGAEHAKPSFGDNLVFFFDYQINFMYWRYFMWNFAGRQNEFHSTSPSDLLLGNWECGIPFLDKARLGDQTDAPGYLKNNGGKNHYYLLPLLLGLIGLFFQCGRDGRGAWLNFLMFFMTGIAIVLYLNQPPYQVRERDYAYAGSFYFFSVWIGLAVAAICSLIDRREWKKDSHRTAVASAVALLCLGVPTLMASENWDDHDRSNRKTAAEIGYNYLNSVGRNGMLITHGDNDTFPLWYDQEVEEVRTDVRICNTSLLGTDWHIDQMKYACNESAPLPLSVPLNQYLYGTNEFVYIYDTRDTVMSIHDVMKIFKHPSIKVSLESGKRVNFIASRRISVPVDKANVLKYGILSEKFADMIPDEIVLTIPKGKSYITKPELFMLDLLDGYRWDRPINMLGMGGEINIGIKEYLMYQAFSHKFVPIKTNSRRGTVGLADVDELRRLMQERFRFDALGADNYYVDYQNLYTFCGVVNVRDMFAEVAGEYIKAGDKAGAVALLDKCQEIMPENKFPLDMLCLHLGNEVAIVSMVEAYYAAGAADKATDLAVRFDDRLCETMNFLMNGEEFSSEQDLLSTVRLMYMLGQAATNGGNTELGNKIMNRVAPFFKE